MIQDHLGFLWIATIQSGLYKYDINNNKLIHYKHDPVDSTSIKEDQIRGLYEDRSGTIWVGTNYNGINKYDRETGKFAYCGFRSVAPIYEVNMKILGCRLFYGLSLFDRTANRVIAIHHQIKAYLIQRSFRLLKMIRIIFGLEP